MSLLLLETHFVVMSHYTYIILYYLHVIVTTPVCKLLLTATLAELVLPALALPS